MELGFHVPIFDIDGGVTAGGPALAENPLSFTPRC